jgi:hypothetical protein
MRSIGDGRPAVWGKVYLSVLCIVDMFLHGQARERALEEAIVPGCIVRSAYMSTGLNSAEESTYNS